MDEFRQKLNKEWKRIYDELPKFVSRMQIAKIGIMSLRHIQRLQSSGDRIKNTYIASNRHMYPKEDAIEWLLKHCKKEE